MQNIITSQQFTTLVSCVDDLSLVVKALQKWANPQIVSKLKMCRKAVINATKDGLLTPENYKSLNNLASDMHGVTQSLESVVNPEILQLLNQVKEKIQTAFKDLWDSEENKFEREFEAFDKISQDNNFMSIWSVSEIKSKAINSPVDTQGTAVIYKKCKAELPPNPTWLDMWSAADKVIRQSQDTHHVFVEGFELNNAGVYELYTGS